MPTQLVYALKIKIVSLHFRIKGPQWHIQLQLFLGKTSLIKARDFWLLNRYSCSMGSSWTAQLSSALSRLQTSTATNKYARTY